MTIAIIFLGLLLWSIILTMIWCNLSDKLKEISQEFRGFKRTASETIWPPTLSVEPHYPMLLGGLRGWRVVKRQPYQRTLYSPTVATEELAKLLMSHPHVCSWNTVDEGD